MKKKVILCAAVCALILSMAVGCGQSDTASSQTESHGAVSSTAESAVNSETKNVPAVSSDSDSKPVTATLYIGSKGNFKEYPQEFKSPPTPEQLIAAIAEKTGWNLSIKNVTTSGKGGYVVNFTKECALFTGPPKQQKDEFHMFDALQLNQTILDSIQRTLQAQAPSGDPANQNVYFTLEGNKPLEFTNINVTIPMENPYTSDMFTQKTEIAQG